MSMRDMLPSSQFATIAGSVALAALSIWGAYTLTHLPEPAPAQVAVETQNQTSPADWKQTLADIQAQSPNNRLPAPPSQDSVNALLKAGTTDNLTDTVGRTLLVNLSNAKAQGLGSDAPTQDQLIADAVAQINQSQGGDAYTKANLSLSADSKQALKAYGNAFMAKLSAHTTANYAVVIYAVATSTDNHDASRLAPLKAASADYASLGKDVIAVSVPPSLAPFELAIANNFARMGADVKNMENLYDDPLKALAALQDYEALNQETLQLFINIAQELSGNGILFDKDEPGAAWAALSS